MKRSQLLAVSVLALLLMAAVPLQAAHAQNPYSEKLNVFLAGSDALWFFTFDGVNGSSHLSALESTPGLNWYNVTAISTSGWQSDFQVFGPQGYDLLPVPFLPSQGLFLTVGSDSFADASAAAGALDSYLLTSFVSMSNGTGTYSFYSPVSFSSLVPLTLLRFLPTGEGGFASAISASGFVNTPSPFVVLEGVKSGSGFVHSLVVGSIAYSALSSAGVPSIMSYFGSSETSLRASNSSSSSVIQIRTLDGILRSTDSATVVSDSSTFSGSYTLSLPPGGRVSGINATVVESPAPLLATRAVDTGVLRTGTNITITLTFTNLSPSDTISNVTYADTWWNGTGDFRFLSGDDNLSRAALSPRGTTTPVYRLRYIGSQSGSLTIPASVVSYQYIADGEVFTAFTTLNPIRLSLGVDDAVVYAILTPSGNLGKPVGSTQSLNVTVVNVGTLPASSVVVAGKSIAGLAAKTGSAPGGTATVTVTQSASGLASVNVTRSYGVSYQDPSGTTLQATTNVVSDFFTHVGMVIGFPTLSVSAAISPVSAGVSNVTLTFVSSNFGSDNVTSYKAVGNLPPGLGCGTTSGLGISCAQGVVTLAYSSLNKSTSERPSMTIEVTTPANYILLPFRFQGTTSGEAVTGESNLVAIPAGVQLTKSFAPAALFSGMSSSVQAIALNTGPLKIYNSTVATAIDSFDSVTSTAPLSEKVASISPGENASFTYTVSMAQTYGNLTAVPVTATFYFGGTTFSLQGVKPRVVVYRPLSVTIATVPHTPEEGKNFTITFQITNTAGVSVSNVLFTLPLPTGLALGDLQNAQVSSGTLTVSVGTLAGGSNVTATARAVAGSGITIPFSGAKLSFTYSGATISGVVPKTSGIAISEDVTARYIIPIALVILVMFAVAFYVRRLAASGPASPK